jgi:hypothetical protein
MISSRAVVGVRRSNAFLTAIPLVMGGRVSSDQLRPSRRPPSSNAAKQLSHPGAVRHRILRWHDVTHMRTVPIGHFGAVSVETSTPNNTGSDSGFHDETKVGNSINSINKFNYPQFPFYKSSPTTPSAKFHTQLKFSPARSRKSAPARLGFQSHRRE